MKKDGRLALLLVLTLVLLSCTKQESQGPNLAPETFIVSGPEPGSNQSYRVILAWNGSDPDGEVVAFDIAWHGGPDSTAYLDSLFEWETTQATSDTFDRSGIGTSPRA